MDYELLVFSDEKINNYAKLIKETLEKSLNISIIYKVYPDYIAICHNYMTISMDLDEIIGLDVIQEEYNFTANISIRIQVFCQTLDLGLKLLFQLFGYLTNRNENMLLLENGSEVIFTKKDGKLYIENIKHDGIEYPIIYLINR